MAGSMQEFLSVMRNTLGAIIQISDKVDEQAKGSNEISGELHESANGQAESMNQMRQNLEELVHSIEVIADNATKLANVVADTSEAGGQALNNIQETMKEADGGRTSMTSVTESMEEMKSGMQVLEQSITDVGTAAVKIDEITATIRGIADETNLLAFFESIERTNHIVNEMIKSVYDASDVASNMAAITKEQSASAEEIEVTAVSIQELANIVLENSANVQNDSKELADSTDILKKQISKFTI